MQSCLQLNTCGPLFSLKRFCAVSLINAQHYCAFSFTFARLLGRRLNILLAVLLTLTMAGCSKHTQVSKDVQNYSERLQSFTHISVSTPTTFVDLNAPPKNTLSRPITQVSINLREFYAFNQCALNQLVAQRNTSLGKFQLPSSRYLYELALLHEFTRCRNLLSKTLASSSANELAKNERLIAKLNKWQAIKQKQLPLVWSNFITQSNEIYSSLTQAQDFIAAAPEDNFQSTRQALQFLVKTRTAVQLNSTELENHLKELKNSRLLARMWRTQQYLLLQLDSISPLLEEYIQINQCKNRQQEKDLIIMRNIFTLFFADKIQPLAGELNRYHYQLAPILSQLNTNKHLPEAFTAYIKMHIGKKHDEYKASMQRHIRLWQEIFARCG